ncbi:MAG: DUF3300 domain-containing protein [Rariglobus sp.]|nr:DUF3300 domain-containing protein [Rariglobus sp.]
MNSTTFLFVSALTCLTVGPLQADEVIAASESTAKEQTPLTPAQIDELLAPVALYPDPLIAIILPAATFPADVVMAARYLKDGGTPAAIESQDWDDSVKALARYPDVVKWMDENLAWTKQLGSVFVLQPAAVMSGTQRLRTEAIAAGNLKTTPQQTVVVEREVVRIVPAQREIIYVPVYDPVYVYRPCPVGVVYYPRSVISFSIGYPAGFWLSYDCNWGLNTVVVIGRPYRTVVWNRYPTWGYPSHAVVYHQVWRPSPVCVQTARREFDRRPDYRVSRPTAYSNYQRPSERDTPPRNYTRSDDRDSKPAHVALVAPDATASSSTTTPSQSNDRSNSNRLRPSRAPVVASGLVAEKPVPPSRSERRENRVETQTTSITPPPAFSSVERTLGSRRTQPASAPAQVTASAPVVTRSTPRTVITTNTPPAASPRAERSGSSGFGGHSAMQQQIVSSRSTERTAAPAPASSTSTTSTDDTSDRSPSRTRNWR